ncbi:MULTISPECIES: 5'-methylthioadenosine/adenosylhomocysteine nucleosidase [unclassified Shewanella]|uniref:5'-methylthioadenosine/adenosylhomocysteine nucleosidase n=1 Tax=unclassified Shewanella TaxID=196818 RepID=UPI001BBFDC7C|nr:MULTISPECIES: 5'-methylthioadenosine/adenosylhomocysteine nucleosidase [unclassified Shewanella]GIU15244.1 5'-methylthioadenosine/S-adenosylhomocysteine nucleosidase [Shewanella sp. MBTL60-112-B1]GIU34668.1 5'-methylthioadenosine/S-adenosylhomocysteine nucleosidase [Shewanella sp. MBTL60-112-B2]
MRTTVVVIALIYSLLSFHAVAETAMHAANNTTKNVKPIAILGAMDAEIEKLLPEISHRQTYNVAKNTYYTGFIEGKPVVVARSGVGKVNAAITTYVLINQFDVNSIIFTGIAGAASPELNVADVVISTALVQHDVDLTAFGAPKGQLDGYDDRLFYADKKLQALALNAAKESIGKARVHSGIIATGDQFIADKAVVSMLRQEFNAIAVEMEGAAVAQVTDMFDIPLVVIRTISDKADGSAHLTYEDAKQTTADNSVAITLNMLSKM